MGCTTSRLIPCSGKENIPPHRFWPLRHKIEDISGHINKHTIIHHDPGSLSCKQLLEAEEGVRHQSFHSTNAAADVGLKQIKDEENKLRSGEEQVVVSDKGGLETKSRDVIKRGDLSHDNLGNRDALKSVQGLNIVIEENRLSKDEFDQDDDHEDDCPSFLRSPNFRIYVKLPSPAPANTKTNGNSPTKKMEYKLPNKGCNISPSDSIDEKTSYSSDLQSGSWKLQNKDVRKASSSDQMKQEHHQSHGRTSGLSLSRLLSVIPRSKPAGDLKQILAVASCCSSQKWSKIVQPKAQIPQIATGDA